MPVELENCVGEVRVDEVGLLAGVLGSGVGDGEVGDVDAEGPDVGGVWRVLSGVEDAILEERCEVEGAGYVRVLVCFCEAFEICLVVCSAVQASVW